MKVFTCNNHDGYWPVGAASVVVAETEDGARELLLAELSRLGLGKIPFKLIELDTTQPNVRVLLDGDY